MASDLFNYLENSQVFKTNLLFSVTKVLCQMLTRRVGRKDPEASMTPFLASCDMFFFNRKEGGVKNEIKVQKLPFDFWLCVGVSFCLKTIGQAQKKHR